MALTATLHNFSVQLADMDRNVYADFELRMARQPSETAVFMLVRLLAYCLEFEEGIELTEGVAAVDRPAVWVRDLTGAVQVWIEVGAPDAERIHRGSKQAVRAAIYAHRDADQLIAQFVGKKIHRADQTPEYGFDREFLARAADRLGRRCAVAVSRTEQQLYLDIDGESFSSPLSMRMILSR